MARRAVVLMNLGGPDSPKAVRPFLYNLFSDPAILGLPTVLLRPMTTAFLPLSESPVVSINFMQP